MSSVISSTLILLGFCAGLSVPSAAVLRVCADPSNLPYSNHAREGFENRIADLIAEDLHQGIEYFWFPQRENFFRKTVSQGLCDVVLGVPVGISSVDTTHSYYRSSYVFVSRLDQNLKLSSLDDTRLRALKIGVHVLSEQGDSLPPVYALTSRGIVHNLEGFSLFGNLTEKEPQMRLLDAVVNRQVDVAITWGPLAGYYARHSSVPLRLTPIQGDSANPNLPFHFDIAIGVRKGESALKENLDAALQRRHDEIVSILRAFGVPQLSASASTNNPRKE